MYSRESRRRRLAQTFLIGAAVVGLVVGSVAGGNLLVGPSIAAAASARSGADLPGRLHTSGTTIRTAVGTAYAIRSLAWTGMDTGSCAPRGLGTIGLDQGLAKIVAKGYNTIRLPFSNSCLAAKKTKTISADLNFSLVGLSPRKLMDVVVARAKAHGLNVILEQTRSSAGTSTALWYGASVPQKRWLNDWKALAKRYRHASNVIGFDLHVKPRGATRWGSGGSALDWRAAATRAGNAVLKIDRKVLILVEGGSRAAVKKKPVHLSVAARVVYGSVTKVAAPTLGAYASFDPATARGYGAVTDVPVVVVPVSPLGATWSARDGSWATGYNADLVVSSTVDVTGWTATWPDTTTTSIDKAYGMTCTLDPGVSITCAGADYGEKITAGYPQTVGMTVTATAIPSPPIVTIR